ncbi:hypothetical protein [Paenibacillus alvei]|uniref:hypothetical protein n=1 Tax=Paenibacillus alvei TaxID=44250 RepID=UPI0018CE6441|nr:hypothetical protein [Paenibacillus alvei]MBG9735786.1 hypothetical protein [Paenibacillus alvei]MBG9744355.1 hypothetical protein [Paenibacillus alvei]MCY9577910.1 hypothetical protein [Paenibacillus alvei]MCY9587323.1 hypothetical protein [Paenibacillus alvei]
MTNKMYIICFILLTIVLVAESVMYYRFRKKLSLPFRRIKIDKDELINGYAVTSELQKSYSRLPPELLSTVKMSIQSSDYKYDPIIQTIDLLSKLVLSVSITLMGVVMTINSTVLNLLNNDEVLKKNRVSWVEKVQSMVDSFVTGIEGFEALLIISTTVFSIAATHIVFSNLKQKERNRHLIIIEQVEKEKDKDKS